MKSHIFSSRFFSAVIIISVLGMVALSYQNCGRVSFSRHASTQGNVDENGLCPNGTHPPCDIAENLSLVVKNGADQIIPFGHSLCEGLSSADIAAGKNRIAKISVWSTNFVPTNFFCLRTNPGLDAQPWGCGAAKDLAGGINVGAFSLPTVQKMELDYSNLVNSPLDGFEVEFTANGIASTGPFTTLPVRARFTVKDCGGSPTSTTTTTLAPTFDFDILGIHKPGIDDVVDNVLYYTRTNPVIRVGNPYAKKGQSGTNPTEFTVTVKNPRGGAMDQTLCLEVITKNVAPTDSLIDLATNHCVLEEKAGYRLYVEAVNIAGTADRYVAGPVPYFFDVKVDGAPDFTILGVYNPPSDKLVDDVLVGTDPTMQISGSGFSDYSVDFLGRPNSPKGPQPADCSEEFHLPIPTIIPKTIDLKSVKCQLHTGFPYDVVIKALAGSKAYEAVNSPFRIRVVDNPTTTTSTTSTSSTSVSATSTSVSSTSTSVSATSTSSSTSVTATSNSSTTTLSPSFVINGVLNPPKDNTPDNLLVDSTWAVVEVTFAGYYSFDVEIVGNPPPNTTPPSTLCTQKVSVPVPTIIPKVLRIPVDACSTTLGGYSYQVSVWQLDGKGQRVLGASNAPFSFRLLTSSSSSTTTTSVTPTSTTASSTSSTSTTLAPVKNFTIRGLVNPSLDVLADNRLVGTNIPTVQITNPGVYTSYRVAFTTDVLGSPLNYNCTQDISIAALPTDPVYLNLRASSCSLLYGVPYYAFVWGLQGTTAKQVPAGNNGYLFTAVKLIILPPPPVDPVYTCGDPAVGTEGTCPKCKYCLGMFSGTTKSYACVDMPDCNGMPTTTTLATSFTKPLIPKAPCVQSATESCSRLDPNSGCSYGDYITGCNSDCKLPFCDPTK